MWIKKKIIIKKSRSNNAQNEPVSDIGCARDFRFGTVVTVSGFLGIDFLFHLHQTRRFQAKPRGQPRHFHQAQNDVAWFVLQNCVKTRSWATKVCELVQGWLQTLRWGRLGYSQKKKQKKNVFLTVYFFFYKNMKNIINLTSLILYFLLP